MLNKKINTIKYEPNFKKHNYSKIAQFNCGNDDINGIFRKKLDKLPTTTYLFMDIETNKIISFVSFCASSIQIQNDGLFSYPAVELKLFGVDKVYQHESVTISENIVLKYSEFTFQWFLSKYSKNSPTSLGGGVCHSCNNVA